MTANIKIYIIKVLIIFTLFVSCTSTSSQWRHPTATQSETENVSNLCWATANQQSPVYLCKNVLMCTPEKSGLVFGSIAQRKNAYNLCMFQKGFVK